MEQDVVESTSSEPQAVLLSQFIIAAIIYYITIEGGFVGAI